MARVRISRADVFRAAVQSPGYQAFATEKAEELKAAAIEVFNLRQRHDNEGRVSETTPPRYALSFEIEVDGVTRRLVNTDRAAMWVEFGAHAGGETPVLKYRPMGTALDIVASREAAT